MPVNHICHPLFGFHIAVEAVQSQVFRHQVIVEEGRCRVDMGLGADECIDLSEGFFPALCCRFVKDLIYAGRIDGRQGEKDGHNVMVSALLLDFLQITDDLFCRHATPEAVAAAQNEEVFQMKGKNVPVETLHHVMARIS